MVPRADSASAPMLPAYWTQIHDTLADGNYADGIALHRKLLPTFAALFNEVNPGPLKAMMAQLGLPVGPVSLPLKAPNDTTQALILKAIDGLRAEGSYRLWQAGQDFWTLQKRGNKQKPFSPRFV